MSSAAVLAGLMLVGITTVHGQTALEMHRFFRNQIGLSEDQIASIDRGKAVAKVIPSRTPAEVIVFGAVFVEAPPESYVRYAFDVERLLRSPSYLGVRRFSSPPATSDLEGFSLEPDDIRSLKFCRPGKCAIQLQADVMHELQRSLDWAAPNLDAQVNERMRRAMLEVVRRYQAEGNRVLGSYHDTEHPFDFDSQLRSLVGRSEALPVYLPHLSHYLLDYPGSMPASAQSMLHWERVSFGLKPTLRLNHTIAYQPGGVMSGAQIVVVKQLFASHYFQLALDLTACVPDSGHKGFYLITLKGSSQQGLTGWKGALLRLIVVSRTRSAEEKILVNIKQVLEEKQQAARVN
ncbi:hypothetical protein [Paludibaculum fermentans]|uniref:Uncharacterized protein n=1 Tax=Paludibaculum fermentans TaxID=1473598 RepID=A0A7S7SJG7_PALFE|nr:hypothetical protein [Paludibaculum fermentans]QOY86436.1 hypothetical protein IRI77_27065 [Paludibaculum fermentans]